MKFHKPSYLGKQTERGGDGDDRIGEEAWW